MELSDIPKSRQANETRIKAKKKMIAEEESVNYDSLAEEHRNQMNTHKAQIGKLLQSLSTPIKTLLQASLELDGSTIRLLELEDRVAKLEAQQEKEKDELKHAEKRLKVWFGFFLFGQRICV